MFTPPIQTNIGNYKRKVLVVDDSAYIRERICNAIDKTNNLQVIGEASNAHDALKVINDEIVNIVILDVRMPGGNGVVFLKELKNFDLRPLVIVFTSYSNSIIRKRLIREGASLVLDKANGIDELIKHIS